MVDVQSVGGGYIGLHCCRACEGQCLPLCTEATQTLLHHIVLPYCVGFVIVCSGGLREAISECEHSTIDQEMGNDLFFFLQAENVGQNVTFCPTSPKYSKKDVEVIFVWSNLNVCLFVLRRGASMNLSIRAQSVWHPWHVNANRDCTALTIAPQ